MSGRSESITLAAAAYQTAREELLERIRLRDQNLIAYLAAVGAILGIVFKDSSTTPSDIHYIAAAGLPFICLIFSSIIINHHIVIGRIGEYIATELCQAVRMHCWDTSRTRNLRGNSQIPRAVSQGLLLTLPMVYTAWFMSRAWAVTQAAGARTLIVGLVALNGITFLVIIYMNVAAYRRRTHAEVARAPYVLVDEGG